MVSLANSIKADDIPPQVRIRMLEEDLGTEGVDYFGEGLSEQLFDTPAAIARIWRSRACTRAMTVSAEETADPNGRPLSFEWRLLQGDPARVRITPAEDGRSARDRARLARALPDLRGQPVRSSRVDIGVFASNGVHDSAPAILSMAFPATRPASTPPGPTAPAHRRHRPRRPGARQDLRRPDADGPRRLARRLRLRRRRHAPRLDPHPRRPHRGLHPRRPAHPLRAADGAPLAVEAVSYPLRRDARAGSPSRRSPPPSTLYSLSNPAA